MKHLQGSATAQPQLSSPNVTLRTFACAQSRAHAVQARALDDALLPSALHSLPACQFNWGARECRMRHHVASGSCWHNSIIVQLAGGGKPWHSPDKNNDSADCVHALLV